MRKLLAWKILRGMGASRGAGSACTRWREDLQAKRAPILPVLLWGKCGIACFVVSYRALFARLVLQSDATAAALILRTARLLIVQKLC